MVAERNTIIVSRRQKGNPLLKFIKDIPYEFADVKPDYVTSKTSGVLFLSMRYHNLHPEYIYKRISELGAEYLLRVLLVWADIENTMDTIRELSSVCIHHKLSMLVAWSPEEAAGYICDLRRRAGASANNSAYGKSIQGQTKELYEDQLVETLTKIPRVNKPDVLSIAAHVGNFRNIVRFSDRAEVLEGWGPTKSKLFQQTMDEPFIIQEPFKKRKKDETSTNE